MVERLQFGDDSTSDIRALISTQFVNDEIFIKTQEFKDFFITSKRKKNQKRVEEKKEVSSSKWDQGEERLRNEFNADIDGMAIEQAKKKSKMQECF